MFNPELVFRDFNPRSHEGSDMPEYDRMRDLDNFNPRSHEGSDSSKIGQNSDTFRISIHAPTKGATSSSFHSGIRFLYFNPRSHEGSDIYAGASMTSLPIFQSTLPRRERLQIVLLFRIPHCISIHAPTKGATSFSDVDGTKFKISIHAPTKGATTKLFQIT